MMDDRYDLRDFEREDEDELEVEDERDASAPRVDPIDMHADDWRDEQFGSIKDPVSLHADGSLEIHDRLLDAMEGMMSETQQLAVAHLGYAKGAGSAENAQGYIKNYASLVGTMAKLLDKYEARIKSIGKRRRW